MSRAADDRDVYGLLKPAVDAHTLGVSAVEHLLLDCQQRVAVGGEDLSHALEAPDNPENLQRLEAWIRRHRITRLGFSYRLDADEGAELFGRWMRRLSDRRLLSERGGPIREVYFAGLPAACERVKREHGDRVAVFAGDETPGETLDRLGVPPMLRPATLTHSVVYDEARLRFGRELIRSGRHLEVKPVDRTGYPGFGSASDSLEARLRDGDARSLPPLMRAHVGPYLPDRAAAVRLFSEWTRRLAADGFLDVLSIGTSQLSQSAFGEDWAGRPNGGGVPLNSAEELRAVWDDARPMLVRTYAGTRDVSRLARVYEQTIHPAWHTLSFWWFSRLDGRGPNSLLENLRQHAEALRFIASVGKPFEPNVPHHFAFRGADDVTYIVAGALAARAAKAHGIRRLVLQVMLNTPKMIWGVQDLAKARALLALARELEDGSFRVILQPRAGLDYFSPDLEKAKAQLAAVTALMDDIEPDSPRSPDVIHVVSYSEASHLADPNVVRESIQITLSALEEYRRLRERGEVEDAADMPDVERRTQALLDGARIVLRAIGQSIPRPESPEGLYAAFAAGFLPVPYLWQCREEFPRAVEWPTRLVDGGVQVVDARGLPVSPETRAGAAAAYAEAMPPVV